MEFSKIQPDKVSVGAVDLNAPPFPEAHAHVKKAAELCKAVESFYEDFMGEPFFTEASDSMPTNGPRGPYNKLTRAMGESCYAMDNGIRSIQEIRKRILL